jgi:Zn finger protein HypA/HybF involved in hydrogenase expression
MHEQAYVDKIIEVAKGQGDVIEVRIEVGDLAPVPADHLVEAIKAKQGNWKVDIIEKRATITCDCGYEGNPLITEKTHDTTIYECPRCGNKMPEILDGTDIILKEVEVKEEVAEVEE